MARAATVAEWKGGCGRDKVGEATEKLEAEGIARSDLCFKKRPLAVMWMRLEQDKDGYGQTSVGAFYFLFF